MCKIKFERVWSHFQINLLALHNYNSHHASGFAILITNVIFIGFLRRNLIPIVNGQFVIILTRWSKDLG